MDTILKLQDPLLVVKFQRLCGLVPVQERMKSATAGTVQTSHGSYSECNSKDYMQQNDKYVLKERYSVNNNKLNGREDFRNGQLLPPYGQDDSDSDNGVGKGEGQFPFENHLTPHRIKNKILYYIFRAASFLGEELFFLTFLPFVAWNIDTVVTRRTSVAWCLSMYIGQAIKDVLRWPRPCTPPVIRLETDFSQEFSMPSTHAMAGTAIPMTMLLTITSRYQVPFGLTCSIAVLWMVLVCLSRVYLGVHSPLDILCGASLALILTGSLSFFMEDIDIFLQTHPLGAFVVTSLALALCTICYPKIVKGTTGKGDAVQIVSSVAGVCLGSWLNYQYGFTHMVPKGELFPLTTPNLKLVATSILRFFIGVIVIALIRTVVKSFSIKLASYCLGLEKPDKKNPRVETAYKFLTYYCIGVVVICTIPMVHNVIGLGRPSFSYEVM